LDHSRSTARDPTLRFEWSEPHDLTIQILRTIQGAIGELKVDVDALKGDVKELKGDVKELKGDVNVLKADVKETRLDLADLKVRMIKVEGDVDDVKRGLGQVRYELTELHAEIDEGRADVAGVRVLLAENTRQLNVLTSERTLQNRRAVDTRLEDHERRIAALEARPSANG
jgi:chromosome segregation ATPase